jgi:hypothetical protein
MATFTVTRRAIATAILAAAVLSAPVAYADSRDDQLLATLAAQGIQGDPAQMIAAGHAACDNYGTPALAVQMSALMAQGYSNVQASNIQLDGIRAYCPEKVGGVPLP